jgi:arginase
MGDWTMIGVPTSAGAHHAGQDLAPGALRRRGLVGRLAEAGVAITDTGDLPGSIFAADHASPRARNLEAVVQVASEVADAVLARAAAGEKVLVVGGDCTLTVGVVAGLRLHYRDIGLAYVDGDADLDILHPGFSGILDASGVAHLLGYGEPRLAKLSGESPLLDPSRLAIVGCDPHEVSDEDWRLLAEAGVSSSEAGELAAAPGAVAARALEALQASAGRFVVHFDVDVVDSGDLPLGNFPHYGSGTTLDQVATALRVLVQSPDCVGLILTEVNPTYDPSGQQLDRYIDALVGVLRP